MLKYCNGTLCSTSYVQQMSALQYVFFRATESVWMSQWCIYALCQTNAILQLQCQILAFSSKNGYEHWTEFVGVQRSLGKEKWDCSQVLFKSENPNSPIYSQLFIKSLKVKLHAWLRWLYGCFDFWTEKLRFCFRDVIKKWRWQMCLVRWGMIFAGLFDSNDSYSWAHLAWQGDVNETGERDQSFEA